MNKPLSTFSAAATDDSGEDGFSLIEVLVALALLSTIGALMSQYLVQLKQIDRQTERANWKMLAKAEIRYIGKTLSQSLAIPYAFSSGGFPIVFTGTADKLVFVAPLRISSAGYGIRRVIIGQDSDQHTTTLKLEPARQNKSVETAPTFTEQLNASKSRFAFRFMDENNVWLANWEDTSQLPVAVSITARAKEEMQVSVSQTFRFQNHRERNQ